MKPSVLAFAAASLTLAATLTGAAATTEEHVGIYAEKGDPARWGVPADTPRLKYETETKGIRAALAESQKECRALATGRSACEAQAQAQYRADMEAARGLLSRDRLSSLSPKGFQ